MILSSGKDFAGLDLPKNPPLIGALINWTRGEGEAKGVPQQVYDLLLKDPERNRLATFASLLQAAEVVGIHKFPQLLLLV